MESQSTSSIIDVIRKQDFFYSFWEAKNVKTKSNFNYIFLFLSTMLESIDR